MAIQLVLVKTEGTGSTPPQSWSVASVTYTGNNGASEVSDAQGLTFKPDGTKMYVAQHGNGADIYEYALTTPWDITTATKSGEFDPGHASGKGIAFSADGTVMHSVGSSVVYQFNLSTAYNVASASYELLYSPGDTPEDIQWVQSGSKFYTCGWAGYPIIKRFTAGSAYNVSGSSLDSGQTFNAGSQITSGACFGIFFKPDGTKMWALGSAGGLTTYAFQYTMGTPWDLTTVTYDNVSFNFQSQVSSAQGIFFRPDVNDMYMAGYGTGNDIFQYKT